ncbi:helix-turn-helix domain-containing protein [Chitinophaga nivalis]|uniref:AraC family transcriptional regulator n=1 Tax=Chitinophaga nivalis TaxID=2991709 RepID=A0ABT3II76_9BACT|nr:AraC family transcriptional regulator [Chitinophaga nivalis]MCW3466665.1 AraC family transcriptional regulator [Chitinophaga nivalis]MCW3483644.1 AraC family transcriptional regulator [Chitinophaga nivalis]
MDLLAKLEAAIDASPSSIYIMKGQLEHMFPEHQHIKDQLLLVSGGMAYLKTNNKEYFIPSGHYVWIPKGVMHNVKFNSAELTIHNIYFVDEPTHYQPFYKTFGIFPVSRLLHEMMVFAGKWQGPFDPGSWEFEFLLTLKHLLPNDACKRFKLELPTTADERLLAIIAYMDQHLHEQLTLPKTARHFGFSVRNLTRLFQEQLHISFLQYLKMLRVIKAMTLLQDPHLPISEIAYLVGYSSLAAFSNTFLQLLNMRPSDFRQLK